MKTAISIPEPIFQAAEEMAHNLGISRSELFSTAMAEYLENYKYQNVTDSLNEVYKLNDSALDDELTKMQFNSIQEEDWS
tara:strand:- start:337 stop:576 length:240 start_codon:yes stop_codon:yes gene_type:complete